ncbi:MAG: hypothetical protein HY791_29415 [Deltaproteobacteria bacterium]|nr:hypothetical protein [Deltaproteobacteria bacterium]
MSNQEPPKFSLPQIQAVPPSVPQIHSVPSVPKFIPCPPKFIPWPPLSDFRCAVGNVQYRLT